MTQLLIGVLVNPISIMRSNTLFLNTQTNVKFPDFFRYGFVDFSTQEDLEEALKIKNPELQGRVMLIKKAVKDFKDQGNSKFAIC